MASWRLLQALERGNRLVRVDRLDISRTLRGQSEGGMETLSIAASITGYAITGEMVLDTTARTQTHRRCRRNAGGSKGTHATGAPRLKGAAAALTLCLGIAIWTSRRCYRRR